MLYKQHVQIDTISVVARSHDLILYNRVPKYRADEIWEWEKKGRLFEYWSHMMCMMPIEAYPYCTWAMTKYTDKTWGSMGRWAAQNKQLIDAVYSKIKKSGPMSSADFGGRSEKSSGWWDWKDEKTALEWLYYRGRLMVAYRETFQKYYDLTERVLPANISAEPMAEEDVPLFVVKTTLSSLGIASSEDVRLYLGRFPAHVLWNGRKIEIEKYLDTLQKEGTVEELAISGIKPRFFALRSSIRELKKCSSESEYNDAVKLLSPFDNVVRERHLPKMLWGFDYRIEAFVPPAKRILGYYVLPILDGSRLVGGIDAKAHRKEGILELKSLYLDGSAEKQEGFPDRLAGGLKSFADFHGCDRLKLGFVRPRKAKDIIEDALTHSKM